MENLIEQLPGSYSNVPDETYHRWKGASNSRLSDLLSSPAHALFSMTYRDKVTPALKRGSALHCQVLTPGAFDSRFEVRQDRKTSPDDACTLGANDYASVVGMAEAISEHPVASELLADCFLREHSIVWDDCESGVRCKARIDHICKERDIAIDLKTTTDASPTEFARSIYNYGYHRQGAHYLQALTANGTPKRHFVIIAVESEAKIARNGKPTHAIGVYVLDSMAIEIGTKELSPLLATWKRCETSGEWPAYPEKIQDISLPGWVLKREEKQDE
jgi:exodeoxyribonuclease VIII